MPSANWYILLLCPNRFFLGPGPGFVRLHVVLVIRSADGGLV